MIRSFLFIVGDIMCKQKTSDILSEVKASLRKIYFYQARAAFGQNEKNLQSDTVLTAPEIMT